MKKILKRPLAKSDLVEIWHYIAADNSSNATKYLRTINATLQKLADTPLLGRVRSDLNPQLRSFIIKRHVIFYRIIKGDNIEIVRILHGARDAKSLLEEI